MNIQITGRHIEITDPIKDFIEKRVAKFSKLVGSLCDLNIVLTTEKHRQIAEAVLTTKLGTFTATEDAKDLYSSISSAVEKLEKQIRKEKERRTDKGRNAGKSQLDQQVKYFTATDIGTVSDQAENPEVVEMVLKSKPMALDEALDELKRSGGSFIVFSESSKNQINVLYRRKDGNFGLIRP